MGGVLPGRLLQPPAGLSPRSNPPGERFDADRLEEAPHVRSRRDAEPLEYVPPADIRNRLPPPQPGEEPASGAAGARRLYLEEPQRVPGPIARPEDPEPC